MDFVNRARIAGSSPSPVAGRQSSEWSPQKPSHGLYDSMGASHVFGQLATPRLICLSHTAVSAVVIMATLSSA